MDSVLEGLEFCYDYIHDILITSSSMKEYNEHLKVLLERLQAYDVVINPAKCVFGQPKIKFLDFLISRAEIRSLSERVKAILEYQVRNSKRLMQIPRHAEFLQEGFTRHREKLGTDQRSTTRQCTRENTGNVVIASPGSVRDTARKFDQGRSSHASENQHGARLFTDVSDQSIETATTLQQRRDNGWEPLSFFSKKLSSAEAKYSTFDRELLAIYLAIKHFQHMLEAIIHTYS